MKIISTLTKSEIAGQICELINKHNGWYRRFTPANIEVTNNLYVVELLGNKVIGVGGMRKLSNIHTEFMHLCVRPEFRRQGIAIKLSIKRLNLLETPIALSYIRNNNIPSMMNSLKSGFVPIEESRKRGYNILTFVRFKDESDNVALQSILKETLNGVLYTGRCNRG